MNTVDHGLSSIQWFYYTFNDDGTYTTSKAEKLTGAFYLDENSNSSNDLDVVRDGNIVFSYKDTSAKKGTLKLYKIDDENQEFYNYIQNIQETDNGGYIKMKDQSKRVFGLQYIYSQYRKNGISRDIIKVFYSVFGSEPNLKYETDTSTGTSTNIVYEIPLTISEILYTPKNVSIDVPILTIPINGNNNQFIDRGNNGEVLTPTTPINDNDRHRISETFRIGQDRVEK